MSGSSFTFDGSDFLRGLRITNVEQRIAAKNGVHDAMDDLKRIAVDIAPIDSGDLRRSGHAKVTEHHDKIVGEVSFSAVDNSSGKRFNYAIWTHEADYNLGPISRQSPGTDGYTVGNKYLERPLRGEAEKYMRWIADEIRGAVGN
jgi:hypothetical protein